jgi:hypothetical protein
MGRLRPTKSPQQRAAATRKRRRDEVALVKAYFEKFGDIGSINLSPANLRAMKDALRSGVDHADLVRQREESERKEG